MTALSQFRSFSRPVQLLLLNQLSINIGFYMLIPYLAAYLAGDLGLAIWVVGLVLGVRNFSQQGMFLIGGTLADRLGYKPLIVAGCALRTAGFGLLGVVDSVPALIVASAATGFAGALFNPAVRAYLSHDAGERRVEAFALFNIFYQAGILLGPLIGLALTGFDFQLTCAVAAGVFGVLTILQLRALPQRRSTAAEPDPHASILGDWRSVIANRSFVLFSIAMIGSYVLSFQIYLVLPLEVRRLSGGGIAGTAGVAALFAVSGLLAHRGPDAGHRVVQAAVGTGSVPRRRVAPHDDRVHSPAADCSLAARRGHGCHRGVARSAGAVSRVAGARHDRRLPVRDGHDRDVVREPARGDALRALQHDLRGRDHARQPADGWSARCRPVRRVRRTAVAGARRHRLAVRWSHRRARPRPDAECRDRGAGRHRLTTAGRGVPVSQLR